MKVIKNIIFVAIVFLISIVLLVVGNGYDMYKDAISKIPLTEKVETIKEKENYTKIEEVPEIYIKAVISVEDHRFYKHNGIDIIAIGRATINDIKAMSFVEGGSTITQQLSKNIYFTQEKKITRKIAEVFMSNVYANSKYGLEIRDNAVIHLFLNSGLRLSELKNLSIDDLDLDNGKFSIIGKGNKERTGYINKMTKKAIEEYLRIRDNFNPKTKTLLVSKYGSKMSSTAIEKIIKKAYKLSGINDENYCVHTLRHTCATLLYRNGTDIRTIQELLGHVQIDTTEIYTHLHDQEVMDAMLDHPLSQYKMANAEAFCA